MLRRLSADYPRFKSFDFYEGLNIVVAERTQRSQQTDSRNGTGKTSMIEVLHFLLGANAKGHLCAREDLQDRTFSLTLDWSTDNGRLTVSRSASDTEIQTDPPLPGATHFFGTTLDQWKSDIAGELYPESVHVAGLSVRNLLGYAIRRERDHGFADPLKFTTRATKATVFSTHLAYLLGLDAALIDRYRELAEKQSAARAFRQALKSLDLGEIVSDQRNIPGKVLELRYEMAQLREQIAAFRVDPQYEGYKNRADEITTEIEQLARADEIDKRNEADIRDSIDRARRPADDYLRTAFNELGVALPREVRRRYEEVERFHRTVTENRDRFLHDELRETKERLDDRRRRREALDIERARLLELINERGALETLELLQHALATKEAELGTLERQVRIIDRIKKIQDEVSADQLAIKNRVRADLQTRAAEVNTASYLFTEYARRLYGDGKEAFLTLAEGDRNLEIRPHIAQDQSAGIGNMRTLCFDLVCAVMAHRGRRGPDFLVHDGCIYDGVDQRQVSSGLRLAAEVAEAEGMQYIVAINSDVLDKARDDGFDPEPYLLSPTLTDADETGGLFGFRFDS